jgi:hypothetical protein
VVFDLLLLPDAGDFRAEPPFEAEPDAPALVELPRVLPPLLEELRPVPDAMLLDAPLLDAPLFDAVLFDAVLFPAGDFFALLAAAARLAVGEGFAGDGAAADLVLDVVTALVALAPPLVLELPAVLEVPVVLELLVVFELPAVLELPVVLPALLEPAPLRVLLVLVLPPVPEALPDLEAPPDLEPALLPVPELPLFLVPPAAGELPAEALLLEVPLPEVPLLEVVLLLFRDEELVADEVRLPAAALPRGWLPLLDAAPARPREEPDEERLPL